VLTKKYPNIQFETELMIFKKEGSHLFRFLAVSGGKISDFAKEGIGKGSQTRKLMETQEL